MSAIHSFVYETPHDRLVSMVLYNNLNPFTDLDYDLNDSIFVTDKEYHLYAGVKYRVTVSYDTFEATISEMNEENQ